MQVKRAASSGVQWYQSPLGVVPRKSTLETIWLIYADSGEPTSGLEPLTPAPARSALLAIWVQANGLLAELRPYPPYASTEASLNGLCWLSLLLTDVRSDA
jgi:hypothetical protein